MGGNHFNKVVYHETRFEELQASFWNVPFRAAVKTCAISPTDPWLPYFGTLTLGDSFG
jgi:hypothetical protein